MLAGTAGVYQPGYAAMEQQSMMTQNYAAGAAQGMGIYSAATPAMQVVQSGAIDGGQESSVKDNYNLRPY